MNSTVGWQYTLRSVMFNAPAETKMAALQMSWLAYFSMLTCLSLLKWFLRLMWRLCEMISTHMFWALVFLIQVIGSIHEQIFILVALAFTETKAE